MAISAKVTAMVLSVECGKCGESIHTEKGAGDIIPGDHFQYDGRISYMTCQECGTKNAIGKTARI